jgi:hypothetical protein
MYADHRITQAIAEERYTRRTRRTLIQKTDTRS